jgi:hypothetical protein
MWRLAGLTLALGLAACGRGASQEARFAGALPTCGLPASTLVRQGDHFSFSPGDGALTIEGTVAADGGFAGILNTQAPGKPPFLMTVRGKIGDDEATLDYATPRCAAQAKFARM